VPDVARNACYGIRCQLDDDCWEVSGDVACNACYGIRCQLDDEITGRSVETFSRGLPFMEGELQRKFGSDHGDEWSCHEGAVPCQGCSTASGRSPERLVNFRELLHCMTKLCAQLRCPREHLALLAARDVKFEDLKHQDVACLACYAGLTIG